MTRYGMLINTKKCVGCYACRMACQMINKLEPEEAFISYKEIEQGTYPSVYAETVPVQCMHCENAPCQQVCPTHATYTTESGVVLVDEEKCIGCGTCAIVCPYNAPKVDEEKKKAVRCNGCAERVAAGEKPVCVEACPARALDFGPVGDMEKLGERAAIAPFPRPAATVPNLFVKPSADARPAESKDGVVANLLEVGFRATDKEIME